MKNLRTPWRMEHVDNLAPREPVCLFCPPEPPGDAKSDKSRLLLYRDPLVLVMLNRFPYANGHLLAAPRRHAAELSALSGEEQAALMAMLGFCADTLKRRLNARGVNIGLNLGECAGAGIPDHLHFQIVPRWPGDHNFITVLADIRTIPQHIERTFDLLLPDFQEYRP